MEPGVQGVSMALVESCVRSRGTVTVVATLQVGALILTEAILSFLGAGIPPPTPAWGVIIAEVQDYLTNAWSLSFFPGLAIGLTVLGLNFMRDWLLGLRHLSPVDHPLSPNPPKEGVGAVS